MEIAVIGANGFLGKSIINFFLKRKYNVTAFSRNPIDVATSWVAFNIDKQNDLTIFKKFSYVFYCAAIGVQRNSKIDEDTIFEVNTFFPIRLSNFLKGCETKIITFGTYFEIGNNLIDKEWTEEEIVFSKNQCMDNYVYSKKLFSYYAYTSKTVFHFILPTIYGENEDKNRLIPYLISNFKNGEIVNVSKGDQVRQYIYVDDLICVLWKSLSNNSIDKGVYNVPSAETIQIDTVIKIIYDFFENKGKVIITDDFRDSSVLNLRLKAAKIFGDNSYEFLKIENCLTKYT